MKSKNQIDIEFKQTVVSLLVSILASMNKYQDLTEGQNESIDRVCNESLKMAKSWKSY